ncbi:NUDIX domain-containing protein [Pontibacter silvestris]|uniref:NUDIX domain-containing protein n=1 Tax=Pontibacter silvestris TaxID=2305183 RepID=A0ABW4WVV6_9BACT|nr:NUDIX domain-containing protein [Pontibacter silvestris]MCC9137007.1 NUDIX domain-containing protein [Pontibacter silvestris]
MSGKNITAKQPAGKSSPFLSELTLDCVILGFHEDQLKVLLLRWRGTQEWSLPGGPIRKEESVDQAACRILKERTGLKDIFLQQFQLFGDVERYNRNEIKEKLKHLVEPEKWFERAVSVGYYALVDYPKVAPTPDAFTEECQWWGIDEIPSLLFDHNHLIKIALESLRIQLSWQPIGYKLLPEQFTLPELQRLYETILGRTLDPRNFQRKMLGLGILYRLETRRKGGAHKAPYLYRFNKQHYKAMLTKGSLFFS